MQPLYKKYVTVQGDFLSYEDFNKNFRLHRPESFNFAYDVVDALAASNPGSLALLWVSPEGEVRRFTFAKMKLLSDKAANYFVSLGVKKGDAVMLVLKRHHEFWPILMALHKLGAVGVPATHLLTEKDVVYRCNAAKITTLVCTGHNSGIMAAVEAARPHCPTLKNLVSVREAREGWLSYSEGMEKAAPVFEKPRGEAYAHNEDPLLLYFTSGTTGMPKMVLHDHYYPLGHIVTAVYWQQVQPGGLHLTVSETGWAKSVWGKLYGQWLGGCAVFAYDMDKFVAKELLQLIQDHGITSFCAPPTMYRYMLQEDFNNYDLHTLRHCSVAGEPLNPDMAAEFLKRTGVELREAFGQTELVVTLATFPWMKVCPGSMGKPSPMFDVDLIDEEGNPCPPGVSGEIVVRTHHGVPMGMFHGYYLDEKLTKSVWSNDVYHTGDVAWRDEWGYYWYVGRADDVIKSSGYRIGPFEVESALLEHPAVLETAITAAPDELRGQVVKATIVLKPGFAPSEALKHELQEHVKKVTAPYKYPRIIEFVDALPKTISGKIRRTELRQRDAEKK